MALGNLRNQLLKAGLVDKKQKQQADTQDRHDKKQKSQDKLAEEEAAKKARFDEEQAREAEAQRLKEAERAVEKARHEQQNRVRNICDRWAVRIRKPGERRFYFVRRSGRIGRMQINDAIYDQLLSGALAIVERSPDDEAHVFLAPDSAERIFELDAECIRFWAKSAQPIGFIAEPLT